MTPTHRVVVDAPTTASGADTLFALGDLVQVDDPHPDRDGDVWAVRVTDGLGLYVLGSALEEIVREEDEEAPAPPSDGSEWDGLPAFESLPLGYALGVVAFVKGALDAMDLGED